MKFHADMHIHSVLSPCGDIDMSPSAIVTTAKERGMDIIGLTDHNSTLNADVTRRLGEKVGLHVLMGAEVTTKEEVHCLSFMPTVEKLAEFQAFLDSRVIYFENDVDKFGYQLVVDEEENVLDEVPHLLINALDLPMLELQQKVYEMGGIFIPAHIDRSTFSLSSQLGFVPDKLKFHAMELSSNCRRNNYKFLSDCPWFSDFNFIQSSDAHYVEDIAKIHSVLEMPFFSFDNFKDALRPGEQVIL
ncbi:MAG: PHP domain-containing protein [Bacteroidales bacterium]|jgi:PHP family Zn ribbon phosphoesterase|nr:PHP domain-containing protein [Bacteroidales bacterium]